MTLQRHFETSAELRAYVRELSGSTCLLSFSRGKDAIACWLACREVFDRVVPFHLDMIPGGLRLTEESLAYYEEAFGTPIIRLTHPRFYDWLHEGVFQSPASAEALLGLNIPKITFADCEDYVRDLADAPDAYVAIGARMADSGRRRIALTRNGTADHKRRTMQAVFDWTMDDLVRAIGSSGVRLPVDYHLFGRSLDGLRHTYTGPLRDHYPDDYERLLTWFPLLPTEIQRRKEVARG